MEIPELRIGNLVADLPIVQGGMGVRVSRAPLAAAVANEGGIGTISTLGLADLDLRGEEFYTKSKEALTNEIRYARSLSKGHIAVNIMGVIANANDVIRTSVDEGIKIIVYGAGLPMKLPETVPEKDICLLPIVSSPRAATLILRYWMNKYKRFPAGFILEGPLAGGHLGFSHEELSHIEDFKLSKLLHQLLEAIRPFEAKIGQKIPVITAGGIYTGKDIADNLLAGASGVQMGTRFVCTDECSVSDAFKQAYIDSQESDIGIIHSPVGLPGRAIRNKFIRRVEEDGKQKVKCNYQCLTVCKLEEAHYCIANVLLNSYAGDVDNGLIFCGQNAYRVNKVVSVKELIGELKAEMQYSLQSSQISVVPVLEPV